MPQTHSSLRRALAAVLLCAAVGAESSAQVTFTKDTSSSVVTGGGATFGSAWVDYDADGDLDLFAVNFNAQNNVLYRNEGGGAFTAMTSGQVGTIVSDGGNSFGTSWGDYDNDGDADAFVANANPSTTNEIDFLYDNNGDGTFTRVVTGPIATAGGFTTGGSWVDYDNDGYLDLFAVNNNQVNFLFHNNGNGTFTRILTGDIVTSVARFHGSSWSDYDGDGDMDVFIACNIGSANRLYQNNGDGTFTKITTGAIVTDVGSAQGASWGDYDNDGDMDLFVPNRSDQNNNLYRNNGNGTFTKMTSVQVGTIVSDGGDSFGSGWSDIDNDGDLDLFVANWSNQDNFLYLNDGAGVFIRELSGDVVNDGGESQAAAWGDYDGDGFEDLFVSNGYFANQNDFLYRNDGNANHWLTVTLRGTSSNRSAIGARLKLKATIDGSAVWQLREVGEQTGAFGQNSLSAHFGLGDATTVDSLFIIWPTGVVEYFANVAADQFLTIEEGAPPPPVLLAATSGDSTVELRWRKSHIANFDHYRIVADTLTGPTAEVGAVASSGDTTFTVTGLTNHVQYYFRIAVVNTDSVPSGFSNELAATPLPLVNVEVAVGARWNLLSLPLRVVDSAAASLFPSATSPAYAYEGVSGYQVKSVLHSGVGYWMKFSAPEAVGVDGFARANDTIPVAAGWNLIGSLTEPVATGSIASDPPGIATGQFFGYAQGYSTADTLRPGQGYWVKTDQAGVLILSTGSFAMQSSAIRISKGGDAPPPPPGEKAGAQESSPQQVGLDQNYPNPFNPRTVIRFRLPVRSRVSLTVVNTLGQEVAVLVQGTLGEGVHLAEWDAADEPSGVYFCKLAAFGSADPAGAAVLDVRKLLLVR